MRLSYAGLILAGKRLLRNKSAPVVAFGEYAFATVLLLPAVLLLPGPSSSSERGALAILGLAHTAFTILVFLSGLGHVRTDQAGVFM